LGIDISCSIYRVPIFYRREKEKQSTADALKNVAKTGCHPEPVEGLSVKLSAVSPSTGSG